MYENLYRAPRGCLRVLQLVIDISYYLTVRIRQLILMVKIQINIVQADGIRTRTFA